MKNMSAAALTLGLAASMASCGPEAPAVTVDSDDSLTLIDHPGEALEFVIGPVDLPADGPHIRLPMQWVKLPFDAYMHGFEWEIRNGDGEALPADLLHHVNLIDPDNRELFTPISRRVLAAGRENQHESIPGVIGFPLEEGGRMLIATMFGNPLGEDFADVYLHFKLLYSRADEGLIKPMAVYPFYLDVMGFDGVKDFEVPPGHTERSYTARPGVDARILGIGGHVHDYATELRLEDAATGEVLWRAEPEYNEAGRMVGVPSSKFLLQLGKKIYKDREYRIVVEYENPLAVPAPDMGMGAIGGVVAIMGDGEWPPYDPNDPAYILDLNNTITAPDRMEGHGHGGHGGGHSARPMEGMSGMEMPAAGEGEGSAEDMSDMEMPSGHHPEPEKAGGHDHSGQGGEKQGNG
ncbi:MAG: hypothetical protein P8Y07_06665 [Gemmatimonadales bacterium]